MDYKELIKKVRKIEIKARGLSDSVFSGQYRSAFKGKGMTFSEVREYNYGDDVRSIDWNVSARLNKPFIKIFEEERELTIMLIIDVSGSTYFGSINSLKSDRIAEIAAALAFSAVSNNDKVGAILFSDKTEKFLPPKKGSQYCLRIIREILAFRPEKRGTDYNAPFEQLNNMLKKRCTCFLITDGLSPFDKSLSIFAKKHDLCTVIINDKAEFSLADMGIVCMQDSETGEKLWVDTSDKTTQKEFSKYITDRKTQTEQTFKKLGIDYVNIFTDDDYIKLLTGLFVKRERL